MAKHVACVMTGAPESVDELIHLIGCFDYSLLASACPATRKLAMVFGAALISKLLESKYTSTAHPRTIRGPFVVRADFLHLSFSQAVNRSVEDRYMKSYLSKHSNTLFNYTPNPETRNRKF